MYVCLRKGTMIIMKRNLIAVLMAMSMLLATLAACNPNPPAEETNPQDTQTTETTGVQTEETTGAQTEETIPVEPLVLVADGVSDYVIVRGENAFISEVTASTELQKYLKQITGTEIPIVTDDTAPAAHEIIVGKTNREADGEFDRDELGQDGFVIKTKEDKLYLVGGEQRGSLYAVYEFLEAYLGCRFYTETVEKIPEMKTLSLNPIAEDKQIPEFEYREIDWTCFENGYLCAKRKINGDFAHGNKEPYNRIYEELGGPYFTPADDGHNLSRIIPSSMLAEHPEYFAMSETGERTATQLCFSNPDVFQITLDYLRNLKEQYPYSTFLPISQNDTGGHCKCDDCKRVNEEEGGSSMGSMLRFINRVAAELKDEMPDTYFWTFAYQGTRNAPVETTPADNVIIWLCSIECCFSHTFEECTTQDKINGKRYTEDLKDWSAITDTLYVWNYSTNFRHWNQTNPNFDVLLEDMRFFADNGVDGVHDQSMWGSIGGEFEELRCYLLSKIMWDPYMTKEEYYAHMDDFLEGYYGPGWQSIRAYIDLAEELSEPQCWGIYPDADRVFTWPAIKKVHSLTAYPEEFTADMIRNYESVDWSQYWNWYESYDGAPQILTEGERLFAEAMAAAETDQQKTAIDKSSLQMAYLRAFYEYKTLQIAERRRFQPIDRMIEKFMEAHPDDFTEEEKTELRAAAAQYARNTVYGAYGARNRAMAERMISHRIYTLREGYSGVIDNFDGLDFTKAPGEWRS